MSDFDNRTTEELAYLLWEKQGRPQNRSVQNWVEAEYLANPPASSHRPTDTDCEVDLRMRGLGPLTQGEAPANWTEEPKPKHGLLILSCLAGASLVMGAGLLFSKTRRV